MKDEGRERRRPSEAPRDVSSKWRVCLPGHSEASGASGQRPSQHGATQSTLGAVFGLAAHGFRYNAYYDKMAREGGTQPAQNWSRSCAPPLRPGNACWVFRVRRRRRCSLRPSIMGRFVVGCPRVATCDVIGARRSTAACSTAEWLWSRGPRPGWARASQACCDQPEQMSCSPRAARRSSSLSQDRSEQWAWLVTSQAWITVRRWPR